MHKVTLFCGPIEILKTFKLYPLLGNLGRLALPVEKYRLSQIIPDSVACSIAQRKWPNFGYRR